MMKALIPRQKLNSTSFLPISLNSVLGFSIELHFIPKAQLPITSVVKRENKSYYKVKKLKLCHMEIII